MPKILKLGTFLTHALLCVGLMILSILPLASILPDSPFVVAAIGVWCMTLVVALFLPAPIGCLHPPRFLASLMHRLIFALSVGRLVIAAYWRIQRAKFGDWWASHRSLRRLIIDAQRATELASFQGFTSALIEVPVVIGPDGRAMVHPSVVHCELWPSIKAQNSNLFAKASHLKEGALIMGKRHYAAGALVRCSILLHGFSRLGAAERAALYALQAKLHSLGAKCNIRLKIHDSRVAHRGRTRHSQNGALATELLGAIGGAAVADTALILGLSAAPLVIDFPSSVVGFFVGALFTAFIWAKLARSGQRPSKREE